MQNLHTKSIMGTSENAVNIGIWTGLETFLLHSFLSLAATCRFNLSDLITLIRLNLLAN